MKQILVLIFSVCLILAPAATIAKKSGKGQGQGPTPNESAYENASDNAKFKRGEDWQGGQGKHKGDKYDADMDGNGKQKMKKSKGDKDDDVDVDELDEKGKKSKDKDRDKEKRSKKKGKDDQDETGVDDVSTKKMKKTKSK
jgi:hypothetical protein